MKEAVHHNRLGSKWLSVSNEALDLSNHFLVPSKFSYGPAMYLGTINANEGVPLASDVPMVKVWAYKNQNMVKGLATPQLEILLFLAWPNALPRRLWR